MKKILFIIFYLFSIYNIYAFTEYHNTIFNLKDDSLFLYKNGVITNSFKFDSNDIIISKVY